MYHGWFPIISEEERLKNLIASCDEILEQEPDNFWWMNYRQQAQERLEEIYQAEHPVECDCNPLALSCPHVGQQDEELVF